MAGIAGRWQIPAGVGREETWGGAAPREFMAPSSLRRSSTPLGGHLSTAALVISVVVTLLVYWLAEEYAEVLGEQVEGGSPAPAWHPLGERWPATLADGHRVLRAAARTGAGPAGRGFCLHGRQRGAGRSDHLADSPRMAGWPSRSACAAGSSSSPRPLRPRWGW